MNLYPNPVASELVLNMDLVKDGQYLTEIYDLNGKLISGKTFNVTAGKNQFVLDVNSLTAGMYLLTLTGEDGTKISKSFVKF